MIYTHHLARSGWRWEVAIDPHQWMVGFNIYPIQSALHPWPMWNVFVGPLRVGAYKAV